MNEGLKFNIGADITGLEKGIQDSQKELQNLAQTIKTSTGEPIKAATDNIKKLDAELVKTGKVISDIKAPIVNGANTLNSFGQVARDLPFGFIAIQNNLPGVVDSFGALTKQAGGTLPALKALGASLAGPAGISFAFGAVIAGVTSVIQKYGSLDNAIKVLTASNQQLVKSTMLANEESAKAAGGFAAEEAKVKSLTSALLSGKTSRENQIAYYNELKKIAPDVVAGIKQENLGTTESNLLIDSNIKLRAESIRLRIQEAGIVAVASKNAEDLAIANKKEADAKLRLAAAEAAYKTNVNASVAPGSLQVKTYGDAIANAKAEIKAAQVEIKNLTFVQSQYLNQLNPLTLRIAEINNVTKQRVEELKKQGKAESEALKIANQEAKNYFFELQRINGFISKDEKLTYQQRLANLQNYANTILNVKNSESDRSRALEQANKENNNFFESFKIGVTSLDVFKNALNSQAAVLQENIINQEAYNNSVKSLIPTFDVLAMRQEERNKQLKEQKALLTEFKAPTITAPQGLPTNLLSDDIVKATKEQQDAINKNISNYQAAYNIINDTFFAPMQDLFSNFLSTGKFAINEFGKAILKAIQQIVAKIIATGIIALLITLFTGGFSAGAGGFAGGIKKVGDLVAGSLGFGGNVAAPSFAGIGGGTLGMSGSVNVVLRGSDLVGSINRTNATISRVG